MARVTSLSAQDIKGVPLFQGLDPEALSYVAGHILLRHYHKSMLLFLEGEPSPALYFVAEGQVRIFQTLADGREYTLEHLGPSEPLALVCAFDRGPFPASAEALGNVSAATLEHGALHELLVMRPRFSSDLLALMASRLRRAHARATEMALRTVHERLAFHLLHMASADAEGGASGPIRARAQELGRLIGAARETVVRALKDFERSGAVTVSRGQICVVDRDNLKTWCSSP